MAPEQDSIAKTLVRTEGAGSGEKGEEAQAAATGAAADHTTAGPLPLAAAAAAAAGAAAAAATAATAAASNATPRPSRKHVPDFAEKNSIDLTMHQLYKMMRWGRSLYGTQLSGVGSLFSAIDSDDDGFITKIELQAAFRRLDISESEAQVERIMREIYTRSDGIEAMQREDEEDAPLSIDLSQFVTALAQFGITDEVIGITGDGEGERLAAMGERQRIERDRSRVVAAAAVAVGAAAAAAAAEAGGATGNAGSEEGEGEDGGAQEDTPSVAIIREAIAKRYCEDYDTVVQEEQTFLAGFREMLLQTGGGSGGGGDAEEALSLSPEAVEGAILSVKFFFEAGMHAEAEAEARASLGLEHGVTWPGGLVFPRALQAKESADKYSRAALALERERQEEYRAANGGGVYFSTSSKMSSSSSSSSSSLLSSSSPTAFYNGGSRNGSRTTVATASTNTGGAKKRKAGKSKEKKREPRDEGWDNFFRAQNEANRLVESLAGSIRKREKYRERALDRSGGIRREAGGSGPRRTRGSGGRPGSRGSGGRSGSRRGGHPTAASFRRTTSPRSASPRKQGRYDGMSFEDVERAVQSEGMLEEKAGVSPLSSLPATGKRDEGDGTNKGRRREEEILSSTPGGGATPKPLVPGISISDAFDADSPYHPMVSDFVRMGRLETK